MLKYMKLCLNIANACFTVKESNAGPSVQRGWGVSILNYIKISLDIILNNLTRLSVL